MIALTELKQRTWEAQMAAVTMALTPTIDAIPTHISNKHFFRKHGPGATYGQH